VGTGGAFGAGRAGVGLARSLATPAQTIAKPIAAETLVAAGAGGAGEAARGADAGAGGQFLAELGGGVGTAGGAGLLTRLGRGGLNLGSNILAVPKTTVGGVTLPAGAANIAADIMGELTPPNANIQALRRMGTQTVADQLDSPELKAVERALSNEGGGRTLAEATKASERAGAFNQARVDAVEQSLRTEGRPEEFISGVKERMQDFNDDIARDISSKSDEVESTLRNVGSDASISEQSVIARESIETNLTRARETETAAWDEVKDIADNTLGDTKPVQDRLEGILQDQKNNISPDRAIPSRLIDKTRKLGSEFGDGRETLSELQAYRSDILDEIRTARTDGRYDQARKLNKLQESVLDVMDAADTDGLMKKARVQSKALNDTFQRGEVGKILGLVGDAEEKLGPLRTLESVLATGAEGSQSERLTQFLAATGNEGAQQAEDFLRSKFQQAVISETGDVNLGTAASFLRNNKGALEQLPVLRREIEDAVNTTKRLERQIAFRSKSSKSVNERTQSATILGASPERAVAEVLRGKPFRANSTKELKKLFNTAKTTGQRRGLTRAVYDHVADQSLKTAQDGTRRIDFNALNKNMETLAKSGFFQGQEFQRIKSISNEMRRVARLEKRSLKTSLSLQSESILTDIVASVLGARVGASIGGKTAGGTIQTAGRTAGLARKLVANMDQSKILSLIEEAIYDPDVFRTLLTKRTAKNDLIKATRLRGHLLDLNNDLEAIDEQ
jgi:hypothetical protein